MKAEGDGECEEGGDDEDVRKALQLAREPKYLGVLQRVRDFKERPAAYVGPADQSEAYRLVMAVNEMCVDVDESVGKIFTVVSERFSKRFPELVTHVPDAVSYMSVVPRLGNETDVSQVSLDDVLKPAQVLAVSMTAARLGTEPLSPAELARVERLCAAGLTMANTKKNVLLPFVAARMPHIAPNLTAVLGSEITAQLLAVVGGLEKLTQIPSCNVQVIGKGHETLHGFSRVAGMRHHGLIHGCPLVQECSQEHRTKAMRVVAGRVALASRIDQSKTDPSGAAGAKWSEEIRVKLKKWHAPPPGKTKKALPVPVTDSKKKRGGRRARRLKRLYGETQVQKLANRQRFGESSEDYGETSMGNSLGMLATEGGGKLRVVANDRGIAKRKGDFSKYKHGAAAGAQSTHGQLKGLGVGDGVDESGAPSLSMSAGDGVKLVNPNASQPDLAVTADRYFGDGLGFKKANKKPKRHDPT